VFGLIALVCLYIVLGFMLAAIAGPIAREDVEVKTGVLILVLAGIVAFVGRIAVMAAAEGAGAEDPEGMGVWTSPLINFGALLLTIHLIAKLSWKHSAIIAAIYTAVLFVIVLGLQSCAG
jgi:hypothetical protein